MQMHKEYTIWDIVIAIGLCVLFFMWSSCHSEKRIARKAIERMGKAETRYNGLSDIDTVGAHYCNTKHPVKVGKGQVRYIKGDTITHTDTITSIERSVDTVRLTRTVTVFKYVHDTTVQTDTIENTNRIELQAAEITGLRQDNTNAWDAASKAKVQANKRMWWIIVLIAVILAYIIIKSPKQWLK
jgi:hypothetical protein